MNLNTNNTKHTSHSRFGLTLSLIVILVAASTTSFAQKKLPAGFPVECPQPKSAVKNEVNTSPARIRSDSLMKKANQLLS